MASAAAAARPATTAHVHHAEAARRARRQRRPDHRAAASQARQGRGRALFLQAAQDVRVGGRPRARSSVHAAGRRSRRAQQWAPKMLAKMKTLPELRDVATDQQTAGTTLTLDDRPRQASRYGMTAATDRRHALRRVRPAPGRAIFHPAQQLPRDPGNPAELQGTIDTLDKIYIKSPTTGERCRCRRSRNGRQRPVRRCRSATRASSRRSPSASTWRRAWRSARRPTRSEGDGKARWRARHASTPASRAPRRRSRIRSAPCRC
jgi:hypothetical protein